MGVINNNFFLFSGQNRNIKIMRDIIFRKAFLVEGLMSCKIIQNEQL